MACRDCVLWDLTSLRSDRTNVIADCLFDEGPILASMPKSMELMRTKMPTKPTAGEGCPQFKEREDADR